MRFNAIRYDKVINGFLYVFNMENIINFLIIIYKGKIIILFTDLKNQNNHNLKNIGYNIKKYYYVLFKEILVKIYFV